jgi:hypothetical protein
MDQNMANGDEYGFKLIKYSILPPLLVYLDPWLYTVVASIEIR